MNPNTVEVFGTYPFGLSEEEEERARRLHRESLIVDMLFYGPCGYRAFTTEMVAEIEGEWERHHDPMRISAFILAQPVAYALQGTCAEFKNTWDACGVTVGTTEVTLPSARLTEIPIATRIAEYDGFPWLVKALRADDMRQAQRDGKHAGFINTQDTDGFGMSLEALDEAYKLGMRMIQLTYNAMNFIGAGCTERTNAGVSHFGVQFIRRMNQLGIIVDTSHCGRQTTLDACAISTAPVMASHTSASEVYRVDRAKSDEELRAIAGTGGIIGVYAVPFFLRSGDGVTIESMLDHIDYIARLVGTEHVGIGTDWPLQMTKWGLGRFQDFIGQSGFRPEHNISALTNLIGFDDYRDYPNITRGLVQRGYNDDQIRGILGENFVRVFEHVCG
jgi:membrane dipeptidase